MAKICVICGGKVHHKAEAHGRFCPKCWEAYTTPVEGGKWDVPEWMSWLGNHARYEYESGLKEKVFYDDNDRPTVTLNGYINKEQQEMGRVRVDCYDSEGNRVETHWYSKDARVSKCRDYWKDRFRRVKVDIVTGPVERKHNNFLDWYNGYDMKERGDSPKVAPYHLLSAASARDINYAGSSDSAKNLFYGE